MNTGLTILIENEVQGFVKVLDNVISSRPFTT